MINWPALFAALGFCLVVIGFSLLIAYCISSTIKVVHVSPEKPRCRCSNSLNECTSRGLLTIKAHFDDPHQDTTYRGSGHNVSRCAEHRGNTEMIELLLKAGVIQITLQMNDSGYLSMMYWLSGYDGPFTKSMFQKGTPIYMAMDTFESWFSNTGPMKLEEDK